MTRLLITGGSGLLGSALIPMLEARGDTCTRLSHNVKYPGQLYWNIDSQLLDPSALEGFDLIIHLAGENIGNGRWTKAKKQAIRSSRVEGTKLLCDRIAQLKYPPTAFISASAVGYYGSQGDQLLTENSDNGTGFLAEVCREWENASLPLEELGISRTLLRFGVILSTNGGALPKMLAPFKMYLGGKVGSGKQYMSWISLRDAVKALLFLIEKPEITGPVNITSPDPVTNATFTKHLGEVLKRPTLFPLPSPVAKIALGEMAKELLLSSTRATPSKLLDSGFHFRHQDLQTTLKEILTPR